MHQLPSLEYAFRRELHELARGFTQQAVNTDDFKNLLELTEKEKIKLWANAR